MTREEYEHAKRLLLRSCTTVLRDKQKGGAEFRDFVTYLDSIGHVPLDLITPFETITALPLPSPTIIPRPPKPAKAKPEAIDSIIHATKHNTVPLTDLFKIIAASGWDGSGKWYDYTPEEVRSLVTDYATPTTPPLYLKNLPRNKGRGAYAIIDNWKLWRSTPKRKRKPAPDLNDSVDDLFREAP
jgi:hypothetical protein